MGKPPHLTQYGDDEPPPYDIDKRLKEINEALALEAIPTDYEERTRKVIFNENPVDLEIPVTPSNCSTDDEDDGYGDSTETLDDSLEIQDTSYAKHQNICTQETTTATVDVALTANAIHQQPIQFSPETSSANEGSIPLKLITTTDSVANKERNIPSIAEELVKMLELNFAQLSTSRNDTAKMQKGPQAIIDSGNGSANSTADSGVSMKPDQSANHDGSNPSNLVNVLDAGIQDDKTFEQTNPSVVSQLQPPEDQPPSALKAHLAQPNKPISVTYSLKWRRLLRQIKQEGAIVCGLQDLRTPRRHSLDTSEIASRLHSRTTEDNSKVIQSGTMNPMPDNTTSGPTKLQLPLLQSNSTTPNGKRTTDYGVEEGMIMASHDGQFSMVTTLDIRSPLPSIAHKRPSEDIKPRSACSNKPQKKPLGKSFKPKPRSAVSYPAVKAKQSTLKTSMTRPLISAMSTQAAAARAVQRDRTTYVLTMEQKTEKELKRKQFAQQRLIREQKAKEERLKKQERVEEAFQAWLLLKRKNYPKTHSKENPNNKMPNQPGQLAGSAFFQWLEKKKIQKQEETKLAEMKRKVEEEIMYIRTKEQNDRAFRQWLKRKRASQY